ncbi:hypothetical protein AB4037_19545 [Labrys sp. KB_33_2]|uniref:hypothetical protein n=1 Tax=Labrys sp. KB_33_2 TaxID=3237479 RepID=UPI003F8FF09D
MVALLANDPEPSRLLEQLADRWNLVVGWQGFGATADIGSLGAADTDSLPIHEMDRPPMPDFDLVHAELMAEVRKLRLLAATPAESAVIERGQMAAPLAPIGQIREEKIVFSLTPEFALPDTHHEGRPSMLYGFRDGLRKRAVLLKLQPLDLTLKSHP